MLDLDLSLFGGNFFPEHFEPQRIDQFGFLNFPNGEREFLGFDLGLDRFRSVFADVEFEQGAGVEVEHDDLPASFAICGNGFFCGTPGCRDGCGEVIFPSENATRGRRDNVDGGAASVENLEGFAFPDLSFDFRPMGLHFTNADGFHADRFTMFFKMSI